MTLLTYVEEVRKGGDSYFTLKRLMADCHLSKNSALNAIARLSRQGRLISPARGLYVIVPPEHRALGSLPAEELLPIVMQYREVDYYVSYLSAAQYFGASHQKPARFQVVATKKMKPLIEGQVFINFIYKKSLAKMPIQKIAVKTGYLRLATPELTAFDLVSDPINGAGLNNVATVFSDLIEAIDPGKLLELADQLGEKNWLQRLGFILDKIDPMDVDKKNLLIEKLQEYLTGKMPRFIPLRGSRAKKGCARDKKWRVIVNAEIESD